MEESGNQNSQTAESESKKASDSIRNAVVEKYTTVLREPSRPPSRGGNTRALHSHGLLIDGQRYTFLALGSRKWAYASDTVSFDYNVTPERYRNIVQGSLVVRDKSGKEVVRGDRGFKSTLRTSYR